MLSPGAYVTMRLTPAIFAWPGVLSDRPPVLWWLSPGERRDSVGINCKKGATTENQGANVKYMAYGMYD